MEAVLEALAAAAHDAASYMTSDLRNKALSAGWHPDVANNLHVTFDGKKFTSHVHPDFQQRAFVHEFGTEGVSPTGVMRKFAQNHSDGERAFVLNLGHHMKGLK